MITLDPDQLAAVTAAAAELPRAQEAVLLARLRGETLSAIADRLSTSRQQVTHIQRKALARLAVGEQLVAALAEHIKSLAASRPNNGGEHRPILERAYRHPNEPCRVRTPQPRPARPEPRPRDDPGRESRILRHACEAAVREYRKAWSHLFQSTPSREGDGIHDTVSSKGFQG